MSSVVYDLTKVPEIFYTCPLLTGGYRRDLVAISHVSGMSYMYNNRASPRRE